MTTRNFGGGGRRHVLAIFALVFLFSFAPVQTHAADGFFESLWCDITGFFGFACETEIQVVETKVSTTILPPSEQLPAYTVSTSENGTPVYTTVVENNYIINNPTTVIRQSSGGGSSGSSDGVSMELFRKQVDRIFDSMGNAADGVREDMDAAFAGFAEAFTTALLTVSGNASIGGDLDVVGTLTAGSLSVSSVSSGGAVEAPYFTATSTNQASTFPYASTTALTVSGGANALTIGSLSGFLKATAGAISTSLVSLTSDITGILGIANGGTGASTFTDNRILTGNGTGAIVDEANLTFDGSLLTVVGNASTTQLTTTSNTYLATLGGNVGIGTTSPYAKFSLTATTDTNPTVSIKQSSNTPSSDVFEIKNLSGQTNIAMRYVSGMSSGRLGLYVDGASAFGGTAINTDAILSIASNTNDPTSVQTGVSVARNLVMTAPNANNIVGGKFTANTITGAFAYTGTLKGGDFQALHQVAATASKVYGAEFLTYNVAAGTVSDARAGNFFIQNLNAAGVITNAYGSYSSLNLNGGTITNTYGFYAGDLTTGTQTNTPYSFYASDAGTRNYFAGNTGIGTTSPSAKLAITQSANTSAGGFWIAETGNTDYRSMFMDTSGILSFNGGDTAGALNTATLNAAGAWTNASDRNYKENIEDIPYGLDTLNQMQPRYYEMKGTHLPQVGFIAQELKELVPEVVDGKEGSMGISYGNLVAVVVRAIQELSDKVSGFADSITTAVLNATNVNADKVDTKTLCVGETCITENQLKELLDESGQDPTPTPAPEEPIDDISSDEEEPPVDEPITEPQTPPEELEVPSEEPAPEPEQESAPESTPE